MSHRKGHHPGATWRKCDFQCHTPRDRQWQGSAILPGGDEVLEQARLDWAGEFLSACRGKHLQVIAVTDHHDVCMARYVRSASDAAGGDVVVFPGIEITCNDDAQCLGIFNPGAADEVVTKLLSKLPNVLPAPNEDAKSCVTAPAGVTVADLFSLVDGDTYLREHCILLPHFSDGTAHKHLNVARHHTRFADLNCLGVYTEKPFAELDPGTVEKAHGKDLNWGARRRAILPTGDNRSESWDRLGAHECWIKLGEDTAEGLRQALLADEARITYEQPVVPSERIVELRVLSSLTGPEVLTMSFNEGFTALIGGRGSGKSALLEYLRFGLGRTDRDLPQSEHGPRRDREAELIQDTLPEGFVELVLDREGVREIWRRELASRDTILVSDGSRAPTPITLDAARRRFRARAFYQKGLSTTMNDSATAAEQITGIAAAEVLERRREVDQAISNARRDVTTALQQLAALWQRTLERAQASERVADLRNRVEAIARRLGEEGVSPEHLNTIEDHPKYARARAYLAEVKRVADADKAKLSELVASILRVDLASFSGTDIFPELNGLDVLVTRTRDALTAHLSSGVEMLNHLDASRENIRGLFEARSAEFQDRYAEAVRQQTAHSALIEDNTRLLAELEAAEGMLARAAAAERGAEGAQTSFENARQRLRDLLNSRREILQEAAGEVAGKSSGVLKARVKRDDQPEQYVEALCAILEGSRVQDAETRCSTWVRDLLTQGGQDAWTEVCSSILEAYRLKIMTGSPPQPGGELARMVRGLFFGSTLTDHQTSRVYQALNDASVSAVLSAVPKDHIVLSYLDEGRPLAFEKASPGQQASALLELLLRQSAGTLIIDQPEDDLDNRVIMRIVHLIRSSKAHRQLIFTTHNPNIVVNGDADKVVALRSGERVGSSSPTPVVQLDEDGAIETEAVRNAITRIMEGGRAAFDLRSRKYGFDLRR